MTPQSQRGLSQARSGFKECTDEMCLMEAQLESKMGTLLFELKGGSCGWEWRDVAMCSCDGIVMVV